MCVVSMVVDNWNDHFTQQSPAIQELNHELRIVQLERELELLKNQIKSAKAYDKKTGQPDCEDEEKVEKLKAIAKLLDLDISEVLDLLEG